MIKTVKDKQKEIKKELIKKKKEERNEIKEKNVIKENIELQIKDIYNLIDNDEELIQIRNKRKLIKSRAKSAILEKEKYNKEEQERIEILTELNKDKLHELSIELEKIKEEIKGLKEITNEIIIQPKIVENNDNYHTVITKMQKEMSNSYINKVDIKYNILNESNITITNIIHMADIHIRLSEQHDIYQKIFNQVYEDLTEYKKTNPNTIILICGDLLHMKDKLDANTTLFVWEFLKTLTLIFPTILIPGNHDCIQYSDKIDTITAILKDRPLPNMYYLLYSGVYKYNNIIFGVSSIKDGYILDRSKLNEFIEIKEEMTTICLYHGGINVATTSSTKYKPKKETTTINMFGEYDYYLFGDIHKYQYLNSNKTAAYPGSLISQTLGETDDYHGYLIWDIITGESKYNKIKNEYAHHDIQYEDIIEDNKISERLIKENIDYRKYGTIRIFVDERVLKKISNQYIYDTIKKEYNNIILFITAKTSKNIIINEEEKVEEDNDNNRIEELIRKYISDNIFDEVITEDIKTKIIELLFKIQLETSDNNIKYSKSDWKILWLSFDDMYIYGKGNVIEFYDNYMNNIVGIFGENAIGKSSLIDIITYMLFGRSARDPLDRYPTDLLNKQSKKALGMMMIESNGFKYLIERSCTLDTGIVKKKNDHKLNLYDMIKIDNICDENIKLCRKIDIEGIEYYMRLLSVDLNTTKKFLKTIVGTYDNFISSSVLLQGNAKTFQLKNNEERKNILYEILKINFPQEMIKKINTNDVSLKSQNKNIIDDIFKKYNIITTPKNRHDNLINIKSNLLLLDKSKLDKLESDIIVYKEEYENNDSNIEELSILIENLQSELFNSTELSNYEKINNIELIKENLNNKLLLIDKNISDINNKQIIINEEDKNNIIDEYNKSISNKYNILEEITKLTQQKVLISDIIDFDKQLYDFNNLINPNMDLNELKLLLQTKLKDIKNIDKILDDEKEILNINKSNLDKNLIKQDKIEKNEIYINKKEIKEKYDELMENNLLLMDKTLLLLDNKSKKENSNSETTLMEINKLVKQVTETINLILNRNTSHDFIDRYDELNILLKEYNEIINEKEYIKENIMKTEINIKIVENNERLKSEINIISQNINLLEQRNKLIELNDIYINNLRIDKEISVLYLLNDKNIDITDKYMKLQTILKNELYYLNEKNKLIEEKNKITNILSSYEIYEDQSKNNRIIKQQIEERRQEMRNIQKENTDLNVKINLNDKTSISLKGKIEYIETKLMEYEKIKEDIIIYEVLTKLVGINGVQLYILKNSILLLNTKINNILQNTFGIANTIIINIDDSNNIDMGVKNNSDMTEDLITTFSGMEGVIVELSFKLAILEITEMPKSNMLFIDESISVLDKARLDKINELFNCIVMHYSNVFLITHLEIVKDKMNHSLYIKHYEKKSYINNTNKTIIIEKINSLSKNEIVENDILYLENNIDIEEIKNNKRNNKRNNKNNII